MIRSAMDSLQNKWNEGIQVMSFETNNWTCKINKFNFIYPHSTNRIFHHIAGSVQTPSPSASALRLPFLSPSPSFFLFHSFHNLKLLFNSFQHPSFPIHQKNFGTSYSSNAFNSISWNTTSERRKKKKKTIYYILLAGVRFNFFKV